MFYTLNHYLLIGKKSRSVLKTISEKRYGKDFTYEERTAETICYFSYQSEDADGAEVITLYADSRIVIYGELRIGEVYLLSYGNSYIDFIISQKDYNDDLYAEMQAREVD